LPLHKKVSVSQVLDAINQGEEFRKKYACEDSWDVWRAYYRGDWEDGILPVNLYFMMIRTIVPRIYFRNPGISVTPARPGMHNAVFAQLLERVDNKLVQLMRLKKQMKKIVQDTFLTGTGVLKVGFGAEYTPTPPLSGEATNVRAPSINKSQEQLEYNPNVRANMPWAMRTPPGTFVVPDETECLEEAPWVAHEIVRPVMDVRRDPRFKNRQKVKPMEPEKTPLGLDKSVYTENVTLYEIRDKKFQRVLVATEGVDDFLLKEDDLLQQIHGLNYFTVSFNEDDEVFWGVPDAKILEPRQREINEIKTQAMKHRRLALIKWLAKRNAISEVEASKLLDENVSAIVNVDGDPNMDLAQVQASTIPTDLFNAGEETMMDAREEMGFSRNQFGEYHPKTNTTATESRIVQMATDIRVDERRDMVADMIQDAFELINKIVFQLWTEDVVMDVIGPGGVPLWIRFSPAMLSEGVYRLNIDPDTATPKTRELREAKAMEVYQVFKENPMIDPAELTKYLLREMHGVEYDSLFRGMPKGAGVTQQQALGIGEYTQILNRAGPLGLPVPMQGQSL